MRLTNATEEKPEANRVSAARDREDRVQPQLLLAHVLTELIHVALNSKWIFQGHILRSLLWP
jgi:hypothetical protein